MGGRARSLLRWLRHRSRRVSSFHLTSTTNNDHTATSKDLHAHSLPHQYNAEEEEEEEEQEEEGWQEVAEGPESAPEGCIVFEERGAGPRAPVRTKPPPMDPSKKVGQLNSVPVIALVDLCGLFCSPSFASFLFPSALIVMFGSVRGRRLLTLPSWRGHEIPDGGYRFIVGCGSLIPRVLSRVNRIP